MKFHKIFILLFFILIIIVIAPHFILAEIESTNSLPPSLENFLLFGTFHNDSVLYQVLRSARISIFVSFISLVISIVLCICFLMVHFYYKNNFLPKIVHTIAYFPRLLFLILFCSLLRLNETSQLLMPSSFYVIIILSLSGSIFLLSQTLPEIETYQKSFFVYFATTLPISKYKIFFTHVLRNTYTFPLNIAKQMRDNIMFIALLPFTGVIHLQPEDLGGLIHKYFLDPNAFNEGWWILFFPCLSVTVLVLVFDLTAHQISLDITSD